MKDPFERTKVVVRHLPPAITQPALMEHVDGRFAGRYKWTRFCPGKNSQKNQQYSRIYICFNRPEDVVEFAENFDGHVFVNEKGTQFKAIVEYAPSQRVPKAWSKKDGREGTISKDPEYLEFLELISKPVENLPSAEIQLEKKEAERAGGVKEPPIVTPLMLFVRQKRAAKTVSQRPSANGKLSKRAGGISATISSSSSSKRGSDKRRLPTPMYVLRDSSKNAGRKEKATFILASRQEQKQLSDKSSLVAANGVEALHDETVAGATDTASAVMGSSEAGKKRVVLLKGKEREASLVVTSSVSSSSGSAASKQIPCPDGSGRIIRRILSKEARSSEQVQAQNMEKDKRPPRPPSIRTVSKDRISSISVGDRRHLDDKAAGNDLHSTVSSAKQEKRTRNKERHDRGIWAPLRRSDSSHASDDSLSSSSSLGAQLLLESVEHMSTFQGSGSGKVGDDDMGTPNVRPGRGNSVASHDMTMNHGEMKGETLNFSRHGFSVAENGHRHGGRRGSSHGLKEADGSGNLAEGKHSKRVVGYGSHEKQKWVQKTGSV